jgi:hypothetical protein
MGPITFLLVAVLGILLVIVLMRLFRKPAAQPASSEPGEDLANLQPQQARVGDVISIAGAGDNMTDLDFTADRATWFEAGSRRWFDLSGAYRERRVAMRVDTNDEEVAVSIHNDPRKITIEDLGLSEDDLATMEERQNTADSFEFDGREWLYRLSREAQASRSDQAGQGGAPVGFYYWEFREQGGGGVLAVRKEEGEPFAVTLYSGIKAGDVTVYRGGKA